MGLPTELAVDGARVLLREATADDVAGIVRLLADDQLGATRDNADELEPYLQAFTAIDTDSAHLLVVATDADLLGTFQLSFLPGLARRGAPRAQIEAVRVVANHRGRGLGAAMITWAIEEARQRGCALVQLMSDSSRVDAHRFYERLGFVASHQGFKLRL